MHHIAKPMLIPVIALFAMFATGTGCVQVQSHQYIGVEAFSPTTPGMVQILRRPPTQPHLRLGEITVEPNSNTSVQTIEEKFQNAAAKMGANAVVIVSDKTELMGIENTGPWYGAEMQPVVGRVVVGVAIRYTKPSGQVGGPDKGGSPALSLKSAPAASYKFVHIKVGSEQLAAANGK